MTKCSKQNTKQLAQVHVVGSLLKTQASAVVEIHCKLCRKTLQNIHENLLAAPPSHYSLSTSAAGKPLHYDYYSNLYLLHNMDMITLLGNRYHNAKKTRQSWITLRPHCALPSPPSHRQAMWLIVNMPEEDQAMDIGNMHKNLVKIVHMVPEISVRTDRQTHTQTDILITILRNRSRGRSNNSDTCITNWHHSVHSPMQLRVVY